MPIISYNESAFILKRELSKEAAKPLSLFPIKHVDYFSSLSLVLSHESLKEFPEIEARAWQRNNVATSRFCSFGSSKTGTGSYGETAGRPEGEKNRE